MKVMLNTSPLGNAHAIRGIGMYTRLLQAGLTDLPEIELVPKGPADIIHYPFFDLFQTTLPLKNPSPVVVTIHDVIPLLFPERYPAGIKGKLRFLRQKAALKKVKAIITDSFASKWDIVEQLGVSAESVHVVYLAANPSLQLPTKSRRENIHQKLHLPEKYILYVGDINYNKNLPQLIKALKFLSEDIQLVCVGKNFRPHDIPEWLDIERQIALSDVSERVHFLTEIKAEDTSTLATVYHYALCYVQPSLAEGFGLPVLEAMQCQVPVVAAGNSSLVEVGGDQVIYTGTDAEAIAAAIQAVESWSAKHRKEQIERAADWASYFNWKKVAQETALVYQKVLQPETA